MGDVARTPPTPAPQAVADLAAVTNRRIAVAAEGNMQLGARPTETHPSFHSLGAPEVGQELALDTHVAVGRVVGPYSSPRRATSLLFSFLPERA